MYDSSSKIAFLKDMVLQPTVAACPTSLASADKVNSLLRSPSVNASVVLLRKLQVSSIHFRHFAWVVRFVITGVVKGSTICDHLGGYITQCCADSLEDIGVLSERLCAPVGGFGPELLNTLSAVLTTTGLSISTTPTIPPGITQPSRVSSVLATATLNPDRGNPADITAYPECAVSLLSLPSTSLI